MVRGGHLALGVLQLADRLLELTAEGGLGQVGRFECQQLGAPLLEDGGRRGALLLHVTEASQGACGLLPRPDEGLLGGVEGRRERRHRPPLLLAPPGSVDDLRPAAAQRRDRGIGCVAEVGGHVSLGDEPGDGRLPVPDPERFVGGRPRLGRGRDEGGVDGLLDEAGGELVGVSGRARDEHDRESRVES